MPIQGSTSASFTLGARTTPQSNTIVLMPFEGTSGDTTTQDLALPRKHVTMYGGAFLDTNSKFGNTAVRLNGGQDRIEVLLTERTYTTFTMEAWVNYSNFTTYAPIMSLGIDEDNCIEYATDGQRIRTRIVHNGVEVFNIATAITAIFRNVYRHYVLICDGTNMRFMIDGVTYAYYTGVTFPYPASKLTIGNFLDGINSIGGVDGYIDEVRFSKTVRYSDPYDVPLLSLVYADQAFPIIRNVTGTVDAFTNSVITINGFNFTSDLNVVKFKNAGNTLITSSTVTLVNSQQITATTDTNITNLTLGTVLDVELSSLITYRSITIPNAFVVNSSPLWTTPAGVLATYVMPNRNINSSVSAYMPGNTGETITYSIVSGSLPPNTTFNPATGTVFGQAPEVSFGAQFTFTVRATAANDPARVNDRTFSIIQTLVNPTWSTPAGSLGTVNALTHSWSNQFIATTPDSSILTYSIVSGSAPGGLTLSASGVLSGTADFISSDTTYTFTVRATANSDSFRTADRVFTLFVAGTTVTFNTAAALGNIYDTSATAINLSATASAGTVSYSLVSGTLPTGCSLNTSTGSIGTPSTVTQDSSYSFTLRATTTAGGVTADRAYTVTIKYAYDGSTTARAPTKSTDILINKPGAGNGWYWLKADGTARQYYIDNTYSGGGWVLVATHQFNVSIPTSITYAQSTTGTSIVGSSGFTQGTSDPRAYTTLLPLSLWTAVTSANNAGGNFVMLAAGSAQDPSATAQINRLSKWTWTGWSASYAWTGTNNLSNDIGNTTPGLWSYHIANGYSWTAQDVDQDAYSANCSQSYNNSPWWYGACWDGSFWGGNGNGYQNGIFWTGSSGDYYNYGAMYVK